MSRAISRESFRELNNYLGVYLQQGRAILDADWNENQDIAVSFMRRLGLEALGDGSPNRGFAVDPVFPPPPSLLLDQVDTTGMDPSQALGAILGACVGDLVSLFMYLIFGPILFFLDVPGVQLDGFESGEGLALSSALGQVRIGRDRPYEGTGFLRLSGHPGPVQVTRTLQGVRDLSAFELATFRFRLNRLSPGTMKFFLTDDNGNQSVWLRGNPALAQDIWLAGFAAPLDIRFRIVSGQLTPAVAGQSYNVQLFTYAGSAPIQWAVSAGALPDGLTLAPSGSGEDSRQGRLSGTPTASGTSTFTVQVTDSGGHTSQKQFTLEVRASGKVGLQIPTAAELLSMLGKSEAPTGTPADLTAIRSYGFELYQDATNPLIWDLDDLRLGSSAIQDAAAKNNFIIRGSEFAQVLNQVTLLTVLMAGISDSGGGSVDSSQEQNLLDLLNTDLDLSEPSVENAGRIYVDGLPCLQVDDVLYSGQADPNDDPLTPPPPGVVRQDTVYLDAWTEPVTYIQDPAIRDVALGGPDTATRQAVRHRVRVAQDGGTPLGDGIGEGTLATEGSYTATANRLYLVEIDTAGDIGNQATCRWSDDNASTIQRVIEPIPPQSTAIVVEDAAAFHPGDQILIRKEFGEERHEVSSVFANQITLVSATGSQLQQLPAAARDPAFTTFSLADRPMIQRWNAFEVPIQPDPADSTISSAIDLDDGVKIRFGGRGMRRGDYWTFTTRYLAGDETSGIDPVTRIEQLSFARARGVEHHYATLAVITRDGDAEEPDQIVQIGDRRGRVGNANTASGTLPDIALTGTAPVHLGGLRLPPGAKDSKLLVFWSGDLFLQNAVSDGTANLTMRVSFYSDEMTDPVAEPDKGKIQDREAVVKLGRRPVGFDLPLQLLFSKSDTGFAFLPPMFAPTSLQVFATLSQDGFTVQLTGMQLTAIELKKSF